MRTRRTAAIMIVALALGGCATHQSSLADLPAKELAGHYLPGEGKNWFRPCGAAAADPSWWVTVTEGAVEQIRSARSAGQLRDGERYFVRWRAAVTTGGEIGPNGKGAPALLVREVLEMRSASESDCAAP